MQLFDAFEEDVSGDSQAFRANFIERVLRRVPIIQIAPWVVLQINHIRRPQQTALSGPAGRA